MINTPDSDKFALHTHTYAAYKFRISGCWYVNMDAGYSLGATMIDHNPNMINSAW